jgi:hypothetical protein
MGVGGGGDGIVSEEMVGEERTGAVLSTRGCCRVQTNTKEDSHKLANTQKECKHIYSHIQHTQGIGARSEEEALSRDVRSTTKCCKDRHAIQTSNNTHTSRQRVRKSVNTSTNTNSTYKA